MTHPLTPREKVAEIVEAAILRHYPTAVISDTLDDASDILTALASGSGDHAPVAWRVSVSDGGWIVCGFEKTAFELAAARRGAVIQSLYGPDLLAEIAALRANEKAALKECSEWARKAGEAIGKLETSEAAGIVEGWRDRATEAERKLAEAVGLLRSAQILREEMGLIPEPDSLAAREDAFLSKEAERG